MDWVLGRLRRLGMERWAEGGQWAWLAFSVVIWVLRRARRPDHGVVVSVPVKSGERYLVTLIDPVEAGASPDT